MNSIPQVFSQLERLNHVKIEYSSTLFSYQTMTDILALIKENISKEILNRQEEIKFFNTQQGIGMRKIMFQHYQRILKIISHQHDLISQVSKLIYEKHKSMENSLQFISPIIKQIQHKVQQLDKQKIQFNDKIKKLNEKKLIQKESSFSVGSFLNNEKTQALSQIFQTNKKIPSDQLITNQKNKSIQTMSLFSVRKFDSFVTQAQFSHVQSFLFLKLHEVQQFIKIEKELAERTINKIFQIFDQTMGKGLEKLQKLILNFISVKNIGTVEEIIEKFKDQYQKQNDSSSSVDLICHQSLQEIMNEKFDLQKFKYARKRLYESSENQKQESESNESFTSNDEQKLTISPTFKFACPLIIDSVDQISQFKIQHSQYIDKVAQKKNQEAQDQFIFLFDSFCKENVNTMNK